MQQICFTEDVGPGEARAYTVELTGVLVCNVNGAFYCVENICTHDGSPLDQGTLDGSYITCPRHGAVFDVTTGAVVQLPAVLPLPTYRTEVRGNALLVDVMN